MIESAWRRHGPRRYDAEMNHSSRGLRVLVADDDPLNLRMTARLLRDLGHGGAMVTDGAKALKALEQQTFDLVLLDVQMPELDGYATLRAIRARDLPGRKLPVLMVSGESCDEIQQRFFAAGANGFLVKPLSVHTLAEALSRAVPR